MRMKFYTITLFFTLYYFQGSQLDVAIRRLQFQFQFQFHKCLTLIKFNLKVNSFDSLKFIESLQKCRSSTGFVSIEIQPFEPLYI